MTKLPKPPPDPASTAAPERAVPNHRPVVGTVPAYPSKSGNYGPQVEAHAHKNRKGR
jgi:hypothetical protein